MVQEDGTYMDERGFVYPSLDIYKGYITYWENNRKKCQQLVQLYQMCQNAQMDTGTLTSIYSSIKESIDLASSQLSNSISELSAINENNANALSGNISESSNNILSTSNICGRGMDFLKGVNSFVGSLGEKIVDLHNTVYFPRYESACGLVHKDVEKFM